MNNSRFVFEKYISINSKHTCPSCGTKKSFVRYVDILTGNHIAENVGKCDRKDKCSYWFTPKQYFESTGIKPESIERNPVTTKREQNKQMLIIPNDVVYSSLKNYKENNFTKYLVKLFGIDRTKEVIKKYCIGSSDYWQGSTIFWQLDKDSHVRTGKVMLYYSETGKRVKQPHNHITWVHKQYKTDNNELRQCLFGEQLLSDKSKPIMVVESEKTAIISSVYYPQYLWMATGGSEGMTYEKMKVLKGKKVTLIPDLKAFDKWDNKLCSSADFRFSNFKIFDKIEKNATDEERDQGLDIADYLVRVNIDKFLKLKKELI
jgi:hypothetical protein